MRIELELPDWANRSNLYILSETEPVAYKLKDGVWMVKVGRCHMDGQCCMGLDERHIFPVINGRCIHLKKELGNNDLWRCGLGFFRPLQCCIAERSDMPNCTVKYEEG